MTPENSQSIKPIRPEEALTKKERLFPTQVIESFNELIIQNCVNGSSRIFILRKDVLSLMVEKGLDEYEIYKKHWLDVEKIYEKNGWNVEYNQPGYADDYYEPYYVFNSSKNKLL